MWLPRSIHAATVSPMPITRFAPSPTGFLHIGHALSALFARAEAGPGGRFLVRLEDIDQIRCRPEYAAAIEQDLTWLGLDWVRPVRVQSEHFAEYAGVLDGLRARGLIYPCFCTRSAETAGAPHGLGPIYPGTCRHLSPALRADRIAAGVPHALRLDLARAQAETGPLAWRDLDRGLIVAAPERLGDVVLARKDCPTSYHLSVTWDDALQGVERVTRGEDLFEATHLHRLLQALLGLPVPVWRHHRLLLDANGKRFAKRDKAPTLQAMRDSGKTSAEVSAELGF